MNISTQVGVKVTIKAEHRDGKGNLIARSVMIQPPEPPVCTRPRCLWGFFWEVMFYDLLSTYHGNRMEYAEKHRHKDIPLKYRTGEDSPSNIRQATWAIIKLSFRRYNGTN